MFEKNLRMQVGSDSGVEDETISVKMHSKKISYWLAMYGSKRNEWSELR